MKKREDNSLGASPFRIALSVALTSMAAILLASSFKAAPTADNNLAGVLLANSNAAASAATGTRILVTTTAQKIGGIGTGGCSLQEAIYSAVLHDSLDGGAHGIAIDSTDPDHFITTDCAAGTGNGDIVVLPSGADFRLTDSLDDPSSPIGVDAHNYMGPTATPIIFSAMTIEANGATLEWTGKGNSRLFAIGQASVKTPNGTASGTGGVTLRNAYVKGFHVKGGDGGDGSGGGMGAGGAIYLHSGTLIVETSAFDSNGAVGGRGGPAGSGQFVAGGGGGLGGNGGTVSAGGGAGGGGARGDGGAGSYSAGGGGGGTVASGGNANGGNVGPGGLYCGGTGGSKGANGHNASCLGGGGGGGGEGDCGITCSTYNGGNGNYGGGGGGAVAKAASGDNSRAGNGGFGGGGGMCISDQGLSNCFGGSGGFGGGGGGGAPNNGVGGLFGGYSTFTSGGGGAALGGAIFNDSGALTVHNCTFTNNSVVAGAGGDGSTYNGKNAGGAIFSRNGSLTVVNVTVSGNKSTTAGGGIVAYADGAAANFTLDDTIIANNGGNECYVGAGVSINGAGNLIMSNGSGNFGTCPGAVTNADPQLQALQPPSTNGGKTPTMAIPLFSSAMGKADPGTSLPYDQRYADRPQSDSSPRNGYDIGAYEVCRRFFGGRLVSAICSETHIPPPSTTTLTMQALPSSEGTTSPSPGQYEEELNSVVAIRAIPNSGYHFTYWTGSVAESSNSSTTVTMSQMQIVTANFDAGAPSADLHVTVSDAKTAAVAGAQNTYTIGVNNAGPSYVSGAVVKDTFPSIFTGITYSATQTGGAFGFTVSGSGNLNDTVTLPPGSSITYKATGKLSSAATGTISDTASVTAPSGVTDPNSANNKATDTDNITFKADLKVTVSDGKTAATAGAKNTYTIVVTNVGPSKVIGAAIHDSFPSTFTSVTYNATQSGGASGFSASGSGNINNTVTMPPASKITYKATGTISASATGSISDTATATAPSGVTDPNTGNNSATDTDTL